MSILITQGDASGIGPEVVVKALKRFDVKERENLILIGKKSVFLSAGWNSNLSPLIDTTVDGFRLIKSKTNPYSGRLSFKIFEIAVKLAKKKKVNAVVTAPVSKKAWELAGIKYTGHTDYLRHIFGIELLMCFRKGEINTALLTEHVPLKNVSSFVNKKNILLKMKLFKDMVVSFSARPVFLIAGLNPHCGDGGVIGFEEEREIIPAIKLLDKSGIKAYGPYNPDDLLNVYSLKKAGGGLFMYHDQLIPLIKFLDDKNNIVHITWGLDFIRTSPAHGTAFDISYRDMADDTSMYEAVKTALTLEKNIC